MILIDTSAWIEFYRRDGDPFYVDAVASAIKDNTAAVNGLILVELLAFSKSEKEYGILASDLSSFLMIETDTEVYLKAAEIGFKLRRIGITIPATDLIIAASTVESGAQLLHRDRHYQSITKVILLKERSNLPKDV